MKKIHVRCQSSSYDILIGQGLLARIGPLIKPLGLGPKVLIVTNRRVGGLFLKPVKRSLQKAGFEISVFYLPHGNERDKSEKVLQRLWQAMVHEGLDRTSSVVALGGGVVGDLSGFAAATYMRGIPVIQAPTTLLAQVDSAIGGKTAIDLPTAKNMVGAFYQPRSVIIDVNVLEKMFSDRLGKRALAGSLAEVVKYGVISDPVLFRMIEKQKKNFRAWLKSGELNPAAKRFFENVIWRSVKVKALVVSKDEFETKGRRMILNFGHTFAHGFEAASGYRLSHGEAVAAGMICAASLANKMKLFPIVQTHRLRQLIKDYELPTDLKRYRLPAQKIMAAMQNDKKKKAGKMRYVLPVRIGRVVVKDRIPAKLVRRVLREAGAK